jgi:hypothetical protein
VLARRLTCRDLVVVPAPPERPRDHPWDDLAETHPVRHDAEVDHPDRAPQSGRPEPSSIRPSSIPPSLIRASDADRDRIADRLREALAEGRLTPQEHAERIDLVYAARTYADLTPIVSDLPSGGAPPPVPSPSVPGLRKEVGPPPRREASGIVVVFGGAERKGRWLVEAHTNVLTVFGGVDLDLRRAVLSQREVTINIVCVFGGVSVKVPPGVRVIDSMSAVFSGNSFPGDDPLDPDAPVIRLTGMTLFGGVDVKRVHHGGLDRHEPGRPERRPRRESRGRRHRRDPDGP